MAVQELNPMFVLAGELAVVRDELDEISAREKELNERKGKLEAQLVDMMVNEGVENFRHVGRTFYPIVKTYASIKAENREAAHEWLRDNGYGDLVKEQVNVNSLSSLWKELNEEGAIDEDFAASLSVYDKVSVGVRKGRG